MDPEVDWRLVSRLLLRQGARSTSWLPGQLAAAGQPATPAALLSPCTATTTCSPGPTGAGS